MERFTFTNKYGSSVSIGYNNADFTLLEYEGLTTAEVLPVTYSGYRQHGNSVSHIGIGVRIITISFIDVANSMAQVYERRRNLAKVFNPTMLGTLKYENDYITVVLDNVEVTTQPSPTKRYGTLQEYEVELTAHKPFFRDENMTVITGSGFDFTYTGDIPAPWIVQWEYNEDGFLPGGIYFYNWGNGSSTNIFSGDAEIDLPIGASAAYYGVCSDYNKKGTAIKDKAFGELTFDDGWEAARLRTDVRFANLYPGRVNGGISSSTAQTVKLKYYNWYSGV